MKKIIIVSIFLIYFFTVKQNSNFLYAQEFVHTKSNGHIGVFKPVNRSVIDTVINELDEHLFPGQYYQSYIYYFVNPGHPPHTANIKLTPPVSWCTLSGGKFTSDTCSDVHIVTVSFNAPNAPGTYNTVMHDSNSYFTDMTVVLTVTTTPTIFTVDSTVTIIIGQTETRFQENAWLGFNWTGSYYCGPEPYVPSNQTTVTYSLHPGVPWLTIYPLTFTVNIDSSVTVQKQFNYNTTGTFTTYEMRAGKWFSWPAYIHWTLTVNPIGIKKISSDIPEHFKLFQNYPNPFNPETNIKFDAIKNDFIKIVIYDILGKEIETLVNKKLLPGSYSVIWSALKYPSGIYFYRLITDCFSETKKMLLIK